MNRCALPVDRLFALADLADLPELVLADLRGLARLVSYAVRLDTAGLVAYEVAAALVANPLSLQRLHRAELLHHHFDVAGCGCAVPARDRHYSVHDFPALISPIPYQGGRHVAAA